MKLKNLIKPSAVALGCAGASIAAPFLAPYLATASIPFFGTVLAGLFRADDFQEGFGKVIVNTAAGIFTNLGSSAIEQLPSALATAHNFHLEIMLATAYLDSLATVEKEIRAGDDKQINDQAARIIPLLKARIERGLQRKEPAMLFPLESGQKEGEAAFANRFSAEEFSLSVADEGRWGEQLGEEVEIALRRWLGEEHATQQRAALQTQLGLTTDALLPEPLRSHLRAKLPYMIAHGISELVKRPDFAESWIAFQRAHLQGMLRIVEGIKTSQVDIRDSVNALAQRIEGFANRDVFVEAVADKLEEFLRNMSPQDGLAQLLERQSEELRRFEEQLSAKIDQSTERLSTEGKQNTAHLAEQIGAVDKKLEEAIQLGISSRPAVALAPVSFQWNLPIRNPFFTGRRDVLDQLHRNLTQRGRVALSGLPGIGKTQTAIEYAHLYRDIYKTVFFVKAETRAELTSDFAAAARSLNLPVKDERDQEIVVAAVKHWLESNVGWLLILDNADDLAMARAFLPSNKQGHILLTTRASATGGIAQCVEIDKMQPQEAAYFLLRRAGLLVDDDPLEAAEPEDRDAALTIVAEVDGLTLALDQAGAFIDEGHSTPAEYLALYDKQGAELRADRAEHGSQDHDSVTTTFTLAFKKVDDTNRAAANLLRLCAFLAPDAIPEEILTEGAPELGDELSLAAANPLTKSKLIGEACRFSLLRRTPEARLLSIHRLVQVVLQDGMNEETKRLWAERAVKALNRAFPKWELSTKSEFSNLIVYERLITHALTCADFVDRWDMVFPEAAHLLHKVGLYLSKRVQYDKAEQFYKHALAMREKMLGPDHPDVADSLIGLGSVSHYQGRNYEAEPLYQRALEIQEKALGPDHPDVASGLYHLAGSYYSSGRYAEAESLHKRALEIQEKALGPDHPDVANSLGGLGNVYYVEGRYAKAEPLYQRALEIQETALGPDHPDVAYTLICLAGLNYYQGRYVESEPLYRRAMKIQEKVLGPDHPDVAWSLNSIASVYHYQDRYAEAEPLYKRALEIQEKALGPDHPEVANSLIGLASLNHYQGHYSEAESLYKRALEVQEKAFGPDHPDVANSLSNLAGIYSAQARYLEAEPLYKRERAIYEKVLGPDHPDMAWSLMGLGGVYYLLGRYAEAELLYKSGLETLEKVLTPEHFHVASALSGLAGIYHSQGRYVESEPLYQRALEIQEKVIGPETYDVACSLIGLGCVYYDQGRYAEAEPLHKRALEIQEKLLGPDHPDVALSLGNLGDIYRDQKRYAEAEPCFQRALKILEKALEPEHYLLANSLTSFGTLYTQQGNYAEAEPLHQRALEILEKILGMEHPDTVSCLHNIAELLCAKGDYERAEPLLRHVLAVREKILVPEHPYIKKTRKLLATTEQARGGGASLSSKMDDSSGRIV